MAIYKIKKPKARSFFKKKVITSVKADKKLKGIKKNHKLPISGIE